MDLSKSYEYFQPEKRRNTQSDAAGGHRRFVLRLIMGELHGVEQVFLHLVVRPVGGVMLGGLQQGTEVQHSLDVGIVEVLLDNLPPELDVTSSTAKG